MKDLTIVTVQSELVWENRDANLSFFESVFDTLSGKEDLIILPEMFTSGFTMHAQKMAESMDGHSIKWMKLQAAALEAVIVGSLIIKENGNYYNRLIWMRPNGTYAHYDKRHLFGMGGEDAVYTAGDKKLIVILKGWKICPLVCYDLRFPAWSRNSEDYDLLIYTANWPKQRANHWKSLLVARAIENQCYTVGVNRVGSDGRQLSYQGDTMIVHPSGELLYHKEKESTTHVLTLSGEELKRFRTQLPFLQDRDVFNFEF